MAQQLSHLPHIRNMASGRDKYDPVHQSVWEIYFTLPEQLASQFKQDEALLTEQCQSVSGLDALNKTTPAGQQRFMGSDASFLVPVLDSTYADLSMVFALNLRNVTDNFVFKVFKAWENLSYNLTDGTRGIKTDYISDCFRVAEANRNGKIWRSFMFHNVMLTGCSGLDTVDYTTTEACQLTCTFRSDYWDDELA